MDAFLTATTLVAIAEIGDKTQLLSFVLAARLRMCSSMYFDGAIFTLNDGTAVSGSQIRRKSSWLLARNAAPTAMIERISPTPRQGFATPGCKIAACP
jgi:putative Ca2+/H+ antiporter (TMEM165/GDT1 family)